VNYFNIDMCVGQRVWVVANNAEPGKSQVTKGVLSGFGHRGLPIVDTGEGEVLCMGIVIPESEVTEQALGGLSDQDKWEFLQSVVTFVRNLDRQRKT